MKAPPRIRLSLHWKLALIAVSGVGALAIVLVYFYGQQIVRTADEQFDKRASAIAVGLANECEYGLLIGNRSLVQQAATKVLAQSDVLSAVVFNDAGRVVATAGRVDIDAKNAAGPQLVKSYQAATPVEVNSANQPNADVFYLPVLLRPFQTSPDFEMDELPRTAGQRLGLIELTVSHASTDAAVARARRVAMLITSALAVLISGIGVWVVRQMIHPLHSLVYTTEQLAKGNLQVRVIGGRDDEIGELAESFNKMAESLQLSRAEILNHQQLLQQRVRERTSDLEQEVADHERSEQALAERVRLATFGSEIGIALNQGDILRKMLQACVNAMVQHLDAASAQIWTFIPLENQLEQLAVSGFAECGMLKQVRLGESCIGQIAQTNRPYSTNSLGSDPKFQGCDYVRTHGLTSFAGYPLTVDNRLLGVIIVFARRELSAVTLQALVAAANEIALSMDRKRAEAELENAHKQLVDISRQAGMAEVATNVLHNVGNVLNSVNVSCTLIADNVRKSKVVNFVKATTLLREHAADLPQFIAHDPKGTQLPGYFINLAEHLTQEQADLLNELQSLSSNVEHIKEIVAMQQNYSKVSGVLESQSPVELVEDALRMNAAALTRHDVRVIREYADTPLVLVDKHKVLQILVNLIRNAKYALDEGRQRDKRLTLRVSKNGSEVVKVTVIDNGVGIAPENLPRLFAHGFTTRKHGHGFGLHSGALAAKELGGSLSVHSPGLGQGAVFTLELPCRAKEQRHE